MVPITNHIKKHNLVLCNHIIHNVQAFNILCYWHIRNYFHQKCDNFMKANNELGELCNNLSIKGIHNVHSWNLKHSEVSNYDAEITIPFVLVLYCIVSNICYLVEKINHPFINQHKNRIMTNIIEQQFGLLVLIFGTRKKCLQFAICNSQFCGT